MSSASRRAVHLAVLVGLTGLVTALLVATFAPRAAAHAFLVATVPPAGYAVPTPPASISVTFSEAVSAGVDAITVTSNTHGPVNVGAARAELGSRRIAVTPVGRLPQGSYEVRWRVLSDDGDPVTGTFGFAIGTATTPTAAASAGTPGSTGIALLRGLLFLAIALGLGALVMTWLLPAEARAFAGTPPLRGAAWLGTVATVGLISYVTTEGNPCRGATDAGLSELFGSTSGQVLLAELAAFVIVLALAGRTPALIAAAPLAAVVVAEGIRAHPGAVAGLTGRVLLSVHLGAAAIWTGGLILTLRLSTRAWGNSQRGLAWDVARRYAKVAAILFAVVVLTGTVQSLILIRHGNDLTGTGYGRVLLVKLGLVAIVTGLALAGRWRLRAWRGAPFGHPSRVEAAALVGVLLVTGVLVTRAPPPRTAAFILPPPPVGPVLWQGRLLGNLTVGVAASQGQLRIDANAPGELGVTRVVVTARLGSAPGRTLPLQRCGPGCFSTPVTWRNGANTMTVSARTSGWTGGTDTLRIDWPLDRRPELLENLRRQLTRTPRLSFTETVTSGPGGHPSPMHLTVSGVRLLDSEPWGHADITDVITVARPEGRDLFFALPEETAYFQLTLDQQGRLMSEHFVSHNHDIRRTFSKSSWHDQWP